MREVGVGRGMGANGEEIGVRQEDGRALVEQGRAVVEYGRTSVEVWACGRCTHHRPPVAAARRR